MQMTAGGDVFTTLMWGLRKYAWIVIVFVVGIGVLVPLAQSRADDVYEARAYVGPSGAIVLQNLDVLPRLGENVFSNGAVADTVRRSLGLSGSAAVVPERVELVTAQDNIVFTVIGRGDNPGEAKDVANLA
ncbi:MAG: hypothetical protein H0T17_08185, partial [Propionibacteriales bacterium]|nr:hypothetical protein [Propionibacteriales bacterium]